LIRSRRPLGSSIAAAAALLSPCVEPHLVIDATELDHSLEIEMKRERKLARHGARLDA